MINDTENLIVREIHKFVEEEGIYYIADLWNYAESERAEDWFPVLRKKKNYRLFKFYLKELRSAMRRAKKAVPPPKNSLFDWKDSPQSLETLEEAKRLASDPDAKTFRNVKDLIVDCLEGNEEVS